MVRTRTEFVQYLNGQGLTNRSIEIGVAEGYFSWYLLDHWPGVHYLVDPWRRLDVPGYSVHGDEDQEARYNRVLSKAKLYHGRAIVKRMTSAESVVSFPDGFFDFVYIDANHTFESVREDIAFWWPKVKTRGVLAGHDYLEGEVGGVNYGVKRAVGAFARMNGLTVRATLEKDYPSWWMVKYT